MTKGKINLIRNNLMGYTTETQMYIVQNAGGQGSVNTFHFLKSITKHLTRCLDMGRPTLMIQAPRISKFISYCESQGFEVEVA